jgi:CRISPR-associated endonuclease/helicase Cas3
LASARRLAGTIASTVQSAYDANGVKRLLAKSYDPRYREPPRYALLTGHIEDVAVAARTLYDLSARLALSNAGLSRYEPRMKAALPLYAFMHDQGKANSHFHDILRDGGPPQMVYHEAVSGMLFYVGKLRKWIEPLGQTFHDSLLAVVGHHRRFDAAVTPRQSAKMVVYAAHPDFTEQLNRIRDLFPQLPPPPTLANMHLRYADACGALDVMCRDFARIGEKYDNDGKVYLAILKAYGIAADVAASAIAGKFKDGYEIDRYIKGAFSDGMSAADLNRVINRWAWKKWSASKRMHNYSLPSGFAFRPFQLNAAKSPARLTLLRAGCGSGKSIGAYLWAKEWSMRLGRKVRLFFCLPTTGTTTEHYKDYALHLGVGGNLAHCRRYIDLTEMAKDAPEGDAARRLAEERDKVDALNLWTTPLNVCTADTVLGLMTMQLRSVCAIPAIMDSVVVFDEIHSFDKDLFGNLLVFLKTFPNIPVLLMTATLPKSRLEAIRAIRPDLNVVGGDEPYEKLPRYHIKSAEADKWDEIESVVARNGKVLWVRNTVDRAIDTYLRCKERFPDAKVYLYHSRYKYKNRVIIHRKVIDAFRKADTPVILVATQVAEMSLDLSADLLISDLAPIWAIIQRMGRLNRNATPDRPHPPMTAVITDLGDGHELPYSAQQLKEAREWIKSLTDRDTSQRELIDTFEAVCDDGEINQSAVDRKSVFTHGVWQTRPGQTRAPGHTVGVVLERDYAAYLSRYGDVKVSRTWLRKNEVNIPFRSVVLKWARVGPWFVAPESEVRYDRATGARWKRHQAAAGRGRACAPGVKGCAT